MRKRIAAALGLSIILPLVLIAALLDAATISEVEPNNLPTQANPLFNAMNLNASISPTADVDYFAIPGVNTGWGFIALLDTLSSTASHSGTLTALRSNGTTVLQSDTGSWERGSGIALQNYADGSLTHTLRVSEFGNDARITPYTLRYYQTIVDTQPEVEPNNSRSSGTPSSFTNRGVISPTSDVDCFAFQGRVGDTILLALNGDPEANGSPINPVLELVNPSNVVLKSTNVSGMGGKEFIEYKNLASDGAYAFCVRAAAGTGGATATYTAGLVRNGGLYFPDYRQGVIWQNPRPGSFALVSDTLSFRLTITNTSPITIPGNIRLTATFSPTCLSPISLAPTPTTTSTNYISWNGQKTGLIPGEVYSVTMNMRALTTCNDILFQDTGIAYYFTATGDFFNYRIYSDLIYLPLLKR